MVFLPDQLKPNLSKQKHTLDTSFEITTVGMLLNEILTQLYS